MSQRSPQTSEMINNCNPFPAIYTFHQNKQQYSTVQRNETEARNSRSKLKPGGTHYAIFTFTPSATIHFPMPSSFVMSFVRLNCKVLCHGNRVRVTGSFLRRSCIAFIRIRGLRTYLYGKRKNERMSTDHKTY